MVAVRVSQSEECSRTKHELQSAGEGRRRRRRPADVADGIRPSLLRRTKEQVLTELPEKTEQTLYCEMGRSSARALRRTARLLSEKESVRDDRNRGLAQSRFMCSALLRLRQAACHPGLIDGNARTKPSAKLDVLLEQLEEIISEGHRVLVFSQFTSLLAIVKQRLTIRAFLSQMSRRKDQ